MQKKSKTKKIQHVKIYTTSTCPWCMKTKEFLKAHNIKYEEANVGVDGKSRNEMFEKSGQFGVPVTDANGTIIVGYDKESLQKALGI